MQLDGFFLPGAPNLSDATSEGEWELTSACVKKVFKELHRPHAAVANASLDPNQSSIFVTYLWAVLQAHHVMKDFVDGHFCNHIPLPQWTSWSFLVKYTIVVRNDDYCCQKAPSNWGQSKKTQWGLCPKNLIIIKKGLP